MFNIFYFFYFAKQNHIQKTLGYIAEIFFLIDHMQALIFDQRIFLLLLFIIIIIYYIIILIIISIIIINICKIAIFNPLLQLKYLFFLHFK